MGDDSVTDEFSLSVIPRWLLGSGEMVRRVRERDWAATPLGPLNAWPSSLLTTVAMLLHSRHPMLLMWGPELTQIYNDAFAPSVGGDKHPKALGQAGRECWPEVWPLIGGQIEAVMRDGTPTWMEDALVPIFRDGGIQQVYWTYGYSPVFDEAGNIGGTIIVCTETTSSVNAQAEAETQRARLFEFFKQVPAGVCVFNGEELTFEFANEEYERFVGKSPLAGETLLSAMPELAGQGFDVLLQSVMRTGTPVNAHDVLARQDRGGLGVVTDNYYSFNYSPFEDANGNVTGVIAFVIDVTENVVKRQQNQERERAVLLSEQAARREAEQASRAKDDFLTTASHELRTPLNAILGWAHMLRTRSLDDKDYARATETIERNARAQVRLIEDILDASRIVSGNLRLELRSLDLTTIINAAIEALRPAADAKRIALTVSIDATAAKVTGDPDRLQQVIWNLVSNAIKFTPKGGAVQVWLRRSGTDVELVVQDSGEGIAAEFLPHVFERFRQAQAGTTRRHGGLGLGLALARDLVEAHGGTVRAESAGKDLGSRFTVTLPVQAVFPERPRLNRPSPTPAEPSPTHATLAGVTVLVVDDDEDARDLVSTVLLATGAQVMTAPSAQHALELLATRAFTILVSDIGMPGVDGYELIRQFRTLTGVSAPAMPAIALTAYAREEDRRLALEAGFDAHAAKPIDPDELVRLVAQLTVRAAT